MKNMFVRCEKFFSNLIKLLDFGIKTSELNLLWEKKIKENHVGDKVDFSLMQSFSLK